MSLPGDGVKCLLVSSVQLTYLLLHAHITVGVGQQALYGDENLGESETRAPVSELNAVNTDITVSVHVGMEDLGQESHFRWSEGVEHGDLEIEVEDSTFIGAAHWSSDGCLPVIVAGVQWLGLHTLRSVLSQTLELVSKSLVSDGAGLHITRQHLGHLEDTLATETTVDEGRELGEPVGDVDDGLEEWPPPPAPLTPLQLR